MSTYSSAMYNFVPQFALDFYQHVRNNDRVAVNKKLNEFVIRTWTSATGSRATPSPSSRAALTRSAARPAESAPAAEPEPRDLADLKASSLPSPDPSSPDQPLSGGTL